MNNNVGFNTRRIVVLALFTAIVVVLQLLGSFIHFGIFSISLVLVPIVVGAALCGSLGGAWLGFSFGAVVILSGDAAPFLAVSPLGAVVTVIVKGTLCGLVAGLLYKLFEKKYPNFAVFVSAVASPIVNTGVFLIGCKLFFMDLITSWAEGWFASLAKTGDVFGDFIAETVLARGADSMLSSYVIFGLVGFNFLLELIINIVCSPVIVRLIKAGKRGH